MEHEEIVVLGGGCFWCVEAVFQRLKGVKSVTSGYAGGVTTNPSYESLYQDNTGHAEVIKVVFDRKLIDLKTILEIFFAVHDPTQSNGQGADIGPQYRSIILWTTPEQEVIVNSKIADLEDSGIQVVTEVKQLEHFYEAEPYHQNFYNRNQTAPYCQIVIDPKVRKLLSDYSGLVKEIDEKED